MRNVLKIINREINRMNIPYTFEGWEQNLELPHFIGEISETPTLDEDGLSEYTFILTGYAIKNEIDYLFEVAERLKAEYKPSKVVDRVVIMYNDTITVETNTDGLFRTQTTLKLKEWSV